jgi:hypothetical protein
MQPKKKTNKQRIIMKAYISGEDPFRAEIVFSGRERKDIEPQLDELSIGIIEPIIGDIAIRCAAADLQKLDRLGEICDLRHTEDQIFAVLTDVV